MSSQPGATLWRRAITRPKLAQVLGTLGSLGVVSAVATTAFAPQVAAAPRAAGHHHGAHHRTHQGHATSFFSATTTASALHVAFTQKPADSIITGSLVSDDAGYATSGFDSGGSSDADAAPFYPGSLVAGGPALLCTEVFTCPFTPPAYPLLADASYPQSPNAHVGSSKPSTGIGKVLTVTPTEATADAHPKRNASSTSTGKLSLLAHTPLALSLGSSRASTRIATTGSTLHVHVSSVVSNVSIGPLLKIGAVHTSDAVTIVPGHRPVDRPRVSISHVTVAGQTASINANGVHVAGHTLASTQQKLVQSGIEVRTLGVSRSDHASGARSSAGGIEVKFVAPVTNSPYLPNPLSGIQGLNQIPGVDLNGSYVGELQIGGAGAVGTRQRQPATAVPPPASTGGKHPRHGGGPATTTRHTASSTSHGGKAGQPTRQRATGGGKPGKSFFLTSLSRADLLTLYLALALGTAGIFLGWRGTVSVRRRTAQVGQR